MKKKSNKARDEVNLSHTETRGQNIDHDEIARLQQLKAYADAKAKAENMKLQPLDRVLLSSFQKPRMILERLMIIVNQGRQMMGKKTYTINLLKESLDRLVTMDYLTHEEVEYDRRINHVYILTEKGKEEAL